MPYRNVTLFFGKVETIRKCPVSLQLHINLSSPRLIGFDVVTKKLNFDIQSVICAVVLDDCCISHEGFN